MGPRGSFWRGRKRESWRCHRERRARQNSLARALEWCGGKCGNRRGSGERSSSATCIARGDSAFACDQRYSRHRVRSCDANVREFKRTAAARAGAKSRRCRRSSRSLASATSGAECIPHWEFCKRGTGAGRSSARGAIPGSKTSTGRTGIYACAAHAASKREFRTRARALAPGSDGAGAFCYTSAAALRNSGAAATTFFTAAGCGNPAREPAARRRRAACSCSSSSPGSARYGAGSQLRWLRAFRSWHTASLTVDAISAAAAGSTDPAAGSTT